MAFRTSIHSIIRFIFLSCMTLNLVRLSLRPLKNSLSFSYPLQAHRPRQSTCQAWNVGLLLGLLSGRASFTSSTSFSWLRLLAGFSLYRLSSSAILGIPPLDAVTPGPPLVDAVTPALWVWLESVTLRGCEVLWAVAVWFGKGVDASWSSSTSKYGYSWNTS